MSTVLLIIIGIGIFAAGMLTGMWISNLRIIALSDTYTPKDGRNPVRQAQDEVLQLQNEIIESRAVKRETLPDGTIKATLKVLR